MLKCSTCKHDEVGVANVTTAIGRHLNSKAHKAAAEKVQRQAVTPEQLQDNGSDLDLALSEDSDHEAATVVKRVRVRV